MTAMMILTMVCAVTTVMMVTAESVTVQTPYGALQGSRTALGPDFYVDKYLGIPFAKPPVGYLRFHKPEPMEPWNGTRDATQPGPFCPQEASPPMFHWKFSAPMDEDCLYLNVFTPKVSAGSKPLPVMFFIHGGGYAMGTASGMDLSALAAKGVVVVSTNYRLGALGFFSLEDTATPGNNGLRDQIRALEWVRDAISVFNGDPNDVTIFGQSAGAGSVSLLILSRQTTGLFHKAIPESGSAFSYWAASYPGRDPQVKDTSTSLARALNCDPSDSSRMLACLRTKDVESILNTTQEVQMNNGIYFRPVIDSTFDPNGLFMGVPDVIYRQGGFNNVTIMRGFNKDEASGDPSLDPEDDGLTWGEYINRTEGYLELAIASPFSSRPDAGRIMSLINKTYVPGNATPKQLRTALLEFEADMAMVAPTLKEVQMAYKANAKPQYLYRFSYRSANHLGQAWQGTGHGDELYYALGFAAMNTTMWDIKFVSSWTDEDVRMSEYMMTLWSNFAKYGNPTPDDSTGPQWLPWEQDTPRLMDINVVSKLMDYPTSAGVQLWNNVLDKMLTAHPENAIG